MRFATTAAPWSSIRPCGRPHSTAGSWPIKTAEMMMRSPTSAGRCGSAPDERSSGLIHFNLALAHAAEGDRDRALASAREALNHGHAAARDLAERLGRNR